MQRIVKTEKGNICYEISRKSVKNINLRVRKDGTVCLSLPYFVDYKQADRFVEKNAEFIFSALREIGDNSERDSRSTFYLGEELQVVPTPLCKKEGEIREGKLLLCLPADCSDEELAEALKGWQKRQAEKVFREALDKAHGRFCGKGVDVPYPKLVIRSMTTRWGSCTAAKEKITLSLQLIEKPFICIEYVACHELAHFLVQSHSAIFYKVLDLVMPEHREMKRLLNGK